MSFLDFFRRKKPEQPKPISEEKIPEHIEKLQKELSEKSHLIEEEIEKNKSTLISNLKNKILSLDSIKVEEKREHEKIKSIVKENLQSYILQLKLLIDNLEKTKEDSPSKKLEKIDVHLRRFQKHSFKNYERATILIGKEMLETKEAIISFSQEVNKIYSENQDSIKKLEEILKLKELEKNTASIKKITNEIQRKIKDFEEEKNLLQEQKEKSENILAKFKESDEYKKFLLKKSQSEFQLSQLKASSQKIKDEINLKSLQKQFYEIEEKKEIIKKYKDNFLQTLSQDDEMLLLKILPQDSPSVNEIIFLKENYDKLIKENLSDPSIDYQSQLKQMSEKILSINEAIQQEKKKSEKFEEKISHIKNQIREQQETILKNED